MIVSKSLEEFMPKLLAGDRVACRDFVHHQVPKTPDVFELYHGLLWPAMEKVEKLYRSDRINTATEQMAVRINRCIADQLQMHLKRGEPKGKSVVIVCADGEPEELGAQMTADLLEAKGWNVHFLGGGVPNDEILHLLGQLRPDLLLIFGTKPSGVPSVRSLVDLIREIGVNETMNIMVSAGVFNRAEGLWREVSADLFARSAQEAIELAEKCEPRTPVARASGAPKKRRRRRRPVAVA